MATELNFIFSRNDAGSVAVEFTNGVLPFDLGVNTVKFTLGSFSAAMQVDDAANGLASLQIAQSILSTFAPGLYDARITVQGSVPTLIPCYINSDASLDDGATYLNSAIIDVSTDSVCIANAGGGGGGGGVTPAPSIDYVYGDADILATLKTGKAHLMFVGDSISNDGSGSFVSWPQGMSQYAKPDNWESVYINPAGNPDAMGTSTTISSGASASASDYGTAEPGDTGSALATTTGFLGFNPRVMGIQLIQDGYTPFGQTFRPYIEKDKIMSSGAGAFTYLQHPLYQQSDGSYPFDINNEFVFDAFVSSRVDGVLAGDGEAFVTTARAKPYDNNASQLSHDVDYDLATLDNSAGLHIYAISSLPYTPNSLTGADLEIQVAGNTTTGGWPAAGGWHGSFGGRMRRNGVDGLAVYYAGYGGWKTGNHRYEYGDPSVPNIGAGYAASYSNAGAAEWVKATDANIFFIYLGQNDDWSNGLTVADNIKAVVARYRTIASLAGVVDPKFIICQTSCVTNSTSTYTQMKASAADLAAWAPTQTDCVFLDLQSYLETRFDFSNVSVSNQWKTTYTIDGTHPNLAGMEVMASDFLWTKVLEANGVSIGEAPVNGSPYVRKNATWVVGTESVNGQTGVVVLDGSDILTGPSGDTLSNELGNKANKGALTYLSGNVTGTITLADPAPYFDLDAPIDSAAENGNGAGSVTNIIKLTQAQYDALTPVATTLYIIVG